MASTATTFDTDCKLMLHYDGSDASTTFTDSSASAHTITVTGNTQIDTAQAKFAQSGLFDGSGDLLTTPASSDWTFGTGDFTVDFWVRFSSLPSTSIDFIGQGPENNKWELRRDGAGRLQWNFSGSAVAQANWSPSIDTWYHIAVGKSSGTTNLYVDGTSIASGSDSNNYSLNDAVEIGYLGNAYINGWFDEMRVVKGTAVWTANFTPPVSAYTPPVTASNRLALLGVG